tara:strand:- start:2992 stop:3669 length:678 start_codon:yes stop_codon:yes gene_type:complete
MKKILVFLTLCLHIELFAQQCPMTYTGTDSNATIAITQESLSNFYLTDGVNTIPLTEIQCPIEIGVFYVYPPGPANINYLCTGSSVWSNDENFAIAAWSDDSTTPEIDGMPQGSPFTFGICLEGSSSNFISLSLESFQIENMSGGDNSFSSNGMYLLSSATFTSLENILEIQQSCWPVDINENNQNKKIKYKTDLIGRNINDYESYSGFIFELYYDNSYRKVLKY